MIIKGFRRLTWRKSGQTAGRLVNVMSKIIKHDKVIRLVIIGLAFGARVVNLDYNSPFNDEAIYIVVGRLGIFEWDWWSYNARSWMAGQVYVFPVLTALAYVSGGIVGSRFLSVLFGLVMVEAVVVLAMILTKEGRASRLAGMIAGGLIAFLPASIFVSRLATYDIPSYASFFVGLALLVQAIRNKPESGSLFFMAAVSFLFSFLSKVVTVIYFPLVLAGSYLAIRRYPNAKDFWKKYFLVPLYAAMVIYGLISIEPLMTYAESQIITEKAHISQLAGEMWQQLRLLVLPFVFGLVGLAVKKRWLFIAALVTGMVWMLIPHLIFGKLATLEKHLVVTGAFGAIAAGTGIAGLTAKIRKGRSYVIYGAVIAFGVAYVLAGLNEASEFNRRWPNAKAALAFLEKNVQPGDRVLAETGAAVILATYDQNYPLNTTTFDWLDYGRWKDDDAYGQAVRDGYFKYIEVEEVDYEKSGRFAALSETVNNNLDSDYELVYEQNGFFIYQRKY